MAFKYAVFKINKAKDVLPNNSLTYDIQYVPSEDSFRTTKKVNKYIYIYDNLNVLYAIKICRITPIVFEMVEGNFNSGLFNPGNHKLSNRGLFNPKIAG